MRQGLRPVFDHTTQYVVTVNEVFVRYLMKGSMTVELHEAHAAPSDVAASMATTASGVLAT